MKRPVQSDLLDTLLVGRVVPHIYAFQTPAVPGALKVGDTYRPVSVRLEEWARRFPGLTEAFRASALVGDDKVFRDFSVHHYLETAVQLRRLQRGDVSAQAYSREFFAGATPAHLDAAIEDIHQSARDNDGRYRFYTRAHLPEVHTYARTARYQPRPNQQATIDQFVEAAAAGHQDLLMYAVMRFGKSFTSMCCAESVSAETVLIVSAKADVREEWKKTVQEHVRFAAYDFASKDDLDADHDLLATKKQQGRRVVLFLTLQDLQGDRVKERHKQVFATTVDVLVVDETHYGARAEEYGKVLQKAGVKRRSQLERELAQCDASDAFEAEVKALKARVRLHLSGTPYRILMGDEFSKDQIVAFYQFADIVEEQHAWDRKNLAGGPGDKAAAQGRNEWDNPYFGFPQMIRFAFNPNASSLAMLKRLKDSGQTHAFSALLRPRAIGRSAKGLHRKFKHEREVLELFQAIDGSRQDENLLGLLDDPRVHNGKLCRHIVCVLPFRASCDALEALLRDHSAAFLHLRDYEVVNIAGLDGDKRYPTAMAVKAAIRKAEAADKKTLTLTVNRMLTGSTVEQWDTMLYLKDTASPQEYDQAIFRLQNQYVTTYVSPGGETVKYNMKPQTLLVDFDPGRVFEMQARKALFYNANVDEKGSEKLARRIARELDISPVIVVNRDRLEQVTPTNVIDAIRRYSQDRSILDEARDVPFDAGLLEVEDVLAFISKLEPVDSRRGLSVNAAEGDGMDLDIPPPATGDGEEDAGSPDDEAAADAPAQPVPSAEDVEESLREKQLAAYYTRVLFYAFLTPSAVASLEQVLVSMGQGADNRRIARNVGLAKAEVALLLAHASPLFLEQLEFKIDNINRLGRDATLPPLARARVAMKKFARVSDTEVVMPAKAAADLVAMLPEDLIRDGGAILDLAAKQGELAIALWERFGGRMPGFADRIVSIPTSGLAYELTRKVYESLGLPVGNVMGLTTFALLGEQADECRRRIAARGVSVVVGGPPYHQIDGGGRGDSGAAIYHRFHEFALSLEPRALAMLIKANWYSGGKGKGLKAFRAAMLAERRLAILHDYPDPTTYIQTPVSLRGGLCSYLWRADGDGDCEVHNHINGQTHTAVRPMGLPGVDIFVRFNAGLGILRKVLASPGSAGFLGDRVYPRKPFGLASNSAAVVAERTPGSLKVYLPKDRVGFVAPDAVPKRASMAREIASWKVLVAKASPGDDSLPHAIVSSPIVAGPGSVCTDSHLLVGLCATEAEAQNLSAYMKTRFFRFLMLLAKSNQNMHRKTFRFVPVLEMSRRWTDDALCERFGITEEERRFVEFVVRERD